MLSATQSLEVLPYELKWIESLNRGDASVANEVFHDDAVIHINGAPKPDLSVKEFTQMIGGLLGAFPDLHITIEDHFVSDNKVSTRWTADGTHTGPLGELPASGKRIKVNGIIVDYVQDGKVTERWEQWDQMSMLQQLGVF